MTDGNTSGPLALPVLSDAGAGHVEVDPAEADRKLEALGQMLANLAREGLVIAFSGGVDSAFLLWAAIEGGTPRTNIVAVTAVSPAVPEYDIADARELAASFGLEWQIVETQEINDPKYIRNDGSRCYHCKSALFKELKRIADNRSFREIAYGYTRSDRADIRPGRRAALEAGIRAPLDDVGLVKPEIRHLLARAGIRIANKEASPCLASRIGEGIPVTLRRLADVQAVEEILRDSGIRSARARISGAAGMEFIRLEVSVADMPRTLLLRAELTREARSRGYRWVVLDLEGYRTGGALQ